MTEEWNTDPMLEMYIYETSLLLEQLEEMILQCDRTCYNNPSVQCCLEKLKEPDTGEKWPDKETEINKRIVSMPGIPEATTGTENIYEAVIFFEEGCKMENIRAFTMSARLHPSG